MCFPEMDIVEELRRDPENGAKRLVTEYKAGMMSLAMRFCDDESTAEELVNATFAKVVANIDGYLEQSAFFAWMCQILTNLYRDSVKRMARKSEILSGDAPDMPDDDAREEIFRNVDHSLLRDAIETLPKEMKEAIMLHYIADQPIGVAARFLRLPVSTVKWRLHAARRELARRLGAKVSETARKPGGKALLLALALACTAALGAAVWSLAASGEARVASRMSSSASAEASGQATRDKRQAKASNLSTFQPFNFSTDNSQEENMNKTTTTRAAAILATATIVTSATTAFADASALPGEPSDAYIENIGDGAINTGFLMDADAKIELDYALMETTPQQARLFGANGSFHLYINSYNIMAFGIATSPNFIAYGTLKNANLDRHRAIVDIPGDRFIYTTGTTTNYAEAISGKVSAIPAATIPLALFGVTSDATGLSFEDASYYSAKARIYGFKCWKDGQLVHNFVPCMKGGVAGFKDIVDGAFVTSENPSALTAGGMGLIVENDDGHMSSAGNDCVSGYRRIDTNYTVTPHTRVEFDYALADNYPPDGTYTGNHAWYLFAAGDSSALFNAYYNANGSGWSAGTGSSTQWQTWNGKKMAKPIAGKNVRRTVIIDNDAGFSGVASAGYTNLAVNFTAPAEMLDFGNNTLKLCANQAGTGGYAPVKIYGLKIYEDGSLSRNYVPCVKEGSAALHDTITDEFLFPESRYPAFIASGDIDNIDGNDDAYLESNGTQGINTGYLIKGAETRIEANFAFTDTYKVGNNYQQRAFGKLWSSGNSSEIDADLYINGSGNFMFAFGNTAQNTHGPGVAADFKRHIAVIDGYHSRLHWITGTVTNYTYDVSGDAHDANSTIPLGVFGVPKNAGGTSWEQFSKIRLYSLRIYERDALKHEFVPYMKGDVVGLYDTMTGEVKTDACSSATPLKIGGKGVDGEERWLVIPQGCELAYSANETTLSANASGAVCYKWTKNGAPLDGGEDGDLRVEWAERAQTDTYGVTAIYLVYDCPVEGEPVFCTVKNLPRCTVMIMR